MIHAQTALPESMARRPIQDGVLATSLPLADMPDEMLHRMHVYWASKCRGAGLPARADIDPLEFQWALGLICLLDVVRKPLRFRYRLDGCVIVDCHGKDMTGRSTDEIRPACYAELLHKHFSEIVDTAAPSLYRVTHLSKGELRSYLRLALPLAGDRSNVDMIMTVSSKAMEPALGPDSRHRNHPMR